MEILRIQPRQSLVSNDRCRERLSEKLSSKSRRTTGYEADSAVNTASSHSWKISGAAIDDTLHASHRAFTGEVRNRVRRLPERRQRGRVGDVFGETVSDDGDVGETGDGPAVVEKKNPCSILHIESTVSGIEMRKRRRRRSNLQTSQVHESRLAEQQSEHRTCASNHRPKLMNMCVRDRY